MLEFQHMNETIISLSAPVHTGVETERKWLTVQEAVIRCTELGLPRTPKTVRKWAQLSAEMPDGSGDVEAQRQDTENGFRYLIDKTSLDVKIEQEINFESANAPVGTGADLSEPVGTDAHPFVTAETVKAIGSSVSEPVHTGEHITALVQTGAVAANDNYVAMLERHLDRMHQQLDVKDRQIDALLERDRETNILIQGLQTGFTSLMQALPGSKPDHHRDAA
jgi:hypothetical protein